MQILLVRTRLSVRYAIRHTKSLAIAKELTAVPLMHPGASLTVFRTLALFQVGMLAFKVVGRKPIVE